MELGGKGYQLQRLSGICNVPPFFVVCGTDGALEKFDELGSKRVAVRSSATVEDGERASFAGIFESVLNVDRDNLLGAIRQVLDSAKSDRATQYCERKGIDPKTVEMRVIIQAMVDADVSGVVFTKTANDMDNIIVEACFGLGEALVSGKVTPDNYVVSRKTLDIGSVTVKDERKLTDAQIAEVAKMSLHIEKTLGFAAADIEFCYKDGKLYILQARPVTGLDESRFDLFTRLDKAQNWKNLVKRNYPLLWRSLNVDGFTRAQIKKYTGIDFFVPSKADGKGLYRDITITKETIQLLTNMGKSKLATFDELADKEYALVEKFLTFCEGFRNKSFEKHTSDELIKILGEYSELYTAVTVFRPVPGMFDAFMLPFMQGELEKAKGIDFKLEYLQPQIDLPFISEHKSILSIVARMQKLGLASVDGLPPEIQAMIDQHIAEYDWFLYFQFIGEPMTRKYVTDLIVPLLEIDCAEKLLAMQAEHNQRNQKISKIKRKYPHLAEVFDVGQKFMHLRTYRIDMENKGDFYIRHLLFEVAKRIRITYDELLLLTIGEVADLLGIAEKMLKRKEYYAYLVTGDNDVQLFEGSEFMHSEDKPSDAAVLTGKVAQRGRVTGRVKLLIDNDDIDKINKGDIIVSPMTTPSMVVAILKCGGIITDEGGIACHAAQISREFKIPCIMGTGNATMVLRDNDVVEIVAEGMDGIVRNQKNHAHVTVCENGG